VNILTVEALVSDLHPGAERTDRRKIFDSKTDRLRRCRKATIAKPLPRTPLTLCHNSSAGER
jgi:hypothetical protein